MPKTSVHICWNAWVTWLEQNGTFWQNVLLLKKTHWGMAMIVSLHLGLKEEIKLFWTSVSRSSYSFLLTWSCTICLSSACEGQPLSGCEACCLPAGLGTLLLAKDLEQTWEVYSWCQADWAKVYSHCRQEKPHLVPPLEDVASCYPQHQWEHSANNVFSFGPSRSTEVLGSWKVSVRGVKNWSGSLQREAEEAGLVWFSEGEAGGWCHFGIPLTRGQLSGAELLSVAPDDT